MEGRFAAVAIACLCLLSALPAKASPYAADVLRSETPVCGCIGRGNEVQYAYAQKARMDAQLLAYYKRGYDKAMEDEAHGRTPDYSAIDVYYAALNEAAQAPYMPN